MGDYVVAWPHLPQLYSRTDAQVPRQRTKQPVAKRLEHVLSSTICTLVMQWIPNNLERREMWRLGLKFNVKVFPTKVNLIFFVPVTLSINKLPKVTSYVWTTSVPIRCAYPELPADKLYNGKCGKRFC